MLSIARLSLGRVALCRRDFHFSAGSFVKMVENVPALGESITEGTIASWAKKVGDKVNVDDVIVVIETDKVTVDVKAAHAGVLTQQLAADNVSTHLTNLISSYTNTQQISINLIYSHTGIGRQAIVRDRY